MMKQKAKAAYASPQITVVEIQIDGFVCTSPGTTVLGPVVPRADYPGQDWILDGPGI